MAKFVLKRQERFETQVVVRAPGGAVFDFVGLFRVGDKSNPTDDEIVALFDGWRGVADEDAPNGELEVNDANRAALLGKGYVRLAVVRAYVREMVEMPEKNSATPAAPGPAARAS